MTLTDILVLTGLLATFIFVFGTVWHLVKGEIEYRRWMRKQSKGDQ